jgi:transglutaminase-like putative cysteine protease
MKIRDISAFLLLFALAAPGLADDASTPREPKRPVLRERQKGKVIYRREYISGKWIFEYEYRGNVKGFHPYEYENGSNSQKIVRRTDDTIFMRNIADLSPFSSKAAFPVGDYYKKNPVKNAPPRPVNNSSFIFSPPYDPTFLSMEEIRPGDLAFLKSTAETITKESRTQGEAVESVMEYLRANVSYSLGSSTYAADVIRSGYAFCVGYADAAVYLLRAIGIPARSMSCNVPPGFGWGFGNAGGDHAYVEVYYSDLGWVSYDPQQSVHFVDPFHVTYAPDTHGLPWGVSFRSGKSYGNFTAVIKDAPVFNTYYHRQYIRIRGDLLASSGRRVITGRLTGPAEGTYLLTKTGGSKSEDEMRSFNSSIDGIYNNEFYISMDSGGPSKLRLQSRANGLAITRDIAVSGEEKSIVIDLFKEGKNSYSRRQMPPTRAENRNS